MLGCRIEDYLIKDFKILGQVAILLVLAFAYLLNTNIIFAGREY
jgi:hypothetical protein